MSDPNEKLVNDNNLIDSFSKYAKSYDRYAHLQKSMAERLASLLPSPLPGNVLEIGCGTGLFTRHLLTQPINQLILNDIAPGMLEILGRSLALPKNIKIIPGNAENIIFRKTNLICANAVFQWFKKPQSTLRKLKLALTINGLMVFSIFGPKTLIEFRKSANLESPMKLYTLERLEQMIEDAGFSINIYDVEIRKIFFSSSMTLLKNLQQIGAAPIRRIKTGELRKLMRDYDSRFSTSQGVYSTWELYYFSLTNEN